MSESLKKYRTLVRSIRKSKDYIFSHKGSEGEIELFLASDGTIGRYTASDQSFAVVTPNEYDSISITKKPVRTAHLKRIGALGGKATASRMTADEKRKRARKGNQARLQALARKKEISEIRRQAAKEAWQKRKGNQP